MVFVRNTYNKDDVSKICSVISPMIQCIQPLDEYLQPEELNQVNGLNLKLAVGMFKRFNEGTYVLSLISSILTSQKLKTVLDSPK